MTQIIMSGPIRPLTELELLFARLKLKLIRADREEPPVIERPIHSSSRKPCCDWDFTEEVEIDKRLFVTLARASKLICRHASNTREWRTQDGWERRIHPMDSRVPVYALKDVLVTAEKLKRRRKR